MSERIQIIDEDLGFQGWCDLLGIEYDPEVWIKVFLLTSPDDREEILLRLAKQLGVNEELTNL